MSMCAWMVTFCMCLKMQMKFIRHCSHCFDLLAKTIDEQPCTTALRSSPNWLTTNTQGCIRTAIQRRRRGRTPPPPPMFETDSQTFASAPLVPRGFTLKVFRPAFGGDHRGTLGGGGVPAKPPSPSLSFPTACPSPGGGGGGGVTLSTSQLRCG